MPTDHSHRSPTTPVLMCLPAPGHGFLRLQRLTHLFVFSKATRSRWLPRPLP
jgi:hypothetical protein